LNAASRIAQLTLGRKYRFKVRAINALGVGAFSPETVLTARSAANVPAAPLQPLQDGAATRPAGAGFLAGAGIL
jgi:hypothetical protein